MSDFKNIRVAFETGNGTAHMYSLAKLKEMGFQGVDRLPFSIKILLEAVLREYDDYLVTVKDIETLANYEPKSPKGEIPFKPSRVVLQDFTGVPAVAVSYTHLTLPTKA